MGLQAIDQKAGATVPAEPLGRFPCLADVSAITTAEQVCATDITLQKEFLNWKP